MPRGTLSPRKQRSQSAKDKRLMLVESEFASVLKVISRDGNTLSPTIRQAWESGDLNILTKNQPVETTGAHISIVGHITRDELRRLLTSTESANGFANRFLFGCARRSKCLPEGGNIDSVNFKTILKQLKKAVTFARTAGRITWSEDARKRWHSIYPELSEGKPGLFGSIVARAEAQVVRLATIYALLDCSDEIHKEHLEAALALWKYCEDSARYIFGDALGDAVADEILDQLRARSPEGMTRTEIRNHFKKHKKGEEISRCLKLLESMGLARCETKITPGRPAETWFAT